jgi:hypothetical protein
MGMWFTKKILENIKEPHGTHLNCANIQFNTIYLFPFFIVGKMYDYDIFWIKKGSISLD